MVTTLTGAQGIEAFLDTVEVVLRTGGAQNNLHSIK